MDCVEANVLHEFVGKKMVMILVRLTLPPVPRAREKRQRQYKKDSYGDNLNPCNVCHDPMVITPTLPAITSGCDRYVMRESCHWPKSQEPRGHC